MQNTKKTRESRDKGWPDVSGLHARLVPSPEQSTTRVFLFSEVTQDTSAASGLLRWLADG